MLRRVLSGALELPGRLVRASARQGECSLEHLRSAGYPAVAEPNCRSQLRNRRPLNAFYRFRKRGMVVNDMHEARAQMLGGTKLRDKISIVFAHVTPPDGLRREYEALSVTDGCQRTGR
jgi:hypothetical protein